MYVLRIPRNATNVKLPLRQTIPLTQVPNSFNGPSAIMVVTTMCDDQTSLTTYTKQQGNIGEIAIGAAAPSTGNAGYSAVYALNDNVAAWWLRLPDSAFARESSRHMDVMVYVKDVNGLEIRVNLCVEFTE